MRFPTIWYVHMYIFEHLLHMGISPSLTFSMLGNFLCFCKLLSTDFFLKINFLKKLFQEHHQSDMPDTYM